MMRLDRRRLLKAGGWAGLSMLVTPELLAACSNQPPGPATSRYRFFDNHEGDVIEEATARLIPGPEDDPAEAGHPGAREARVTDYIDTLLAAFTLAPPKVYAGGPFSNRAGNPTDEMADFLGLTPAQAWGWRRRVETWQKQYRAGVSALDRALTTGFTAASSDKKDEILARNEGGFTTLLFGHAIEAMYSNPEYGGNHGRVGWEDIKFPGDVEPRGYTPAEVSLSDGPDVYVPRGPGAALLALVKSSNGV